MSATEIYNMKVNMGLLDLQKYNSLVKEIENIPQRYIDGLELEKIAFNIKEELKLNNDENLDELFLKLQGKNRHVDKTSQEFTKEVEKKSKTKLTKEEKVAILKGELADLVKKEEYEKAAVLRDKIRNMEGK